ncbi:MAG TPA: hypothetical protein VML91_13795, partial [Burkholderiales bacterium]|nr:hypothetical protein [Burkholderiales bacterium]
ARELEYARAVGNSVHYAETVAAIRQLWSGLRRALAARKPAPDLAALDAAIARLGDGRRADPAAVAALLAAAGSLRTSVG